MVSNDRNLTSCYKINNLSGLNKQHSKIQKFVNKLKLMTWKLKTDKEYFQALKNKKKRHKTDP